MLLVPFDLPRRPRIEPPGGDLVVELEEPAVDLDAAGGEAALWKMERVAEFRESIGGELACVGWRGKLRVRGGGDEWRLCHRGDTGDEQGATPFAW